MREDFPFHLPSPKLCIPTVRKAYHLLCGLSSRHLRLPHTSGFPHIYHWFNRKCHSRHKKNAFIWFTDMIDPWFFMELYTTSMSSDFSYNTVSILYSMFITDIPHISHRSPRLCCLKRKIDTFFCYTNKLFFLQKPHRCRTFLMHHRNIHYKLSYSLHSESVHFLKSGHHLEYRDTLHHQ